MVAGLEDITAGFGDDAATVGATLADEVAAERRLLAATCGGVRVASVYVPNGRSLDSEQFAAKLDWLRRLRAWLAATSSPGAPLAVCGDFNIAPDDRDVFDPGRFVGSTHTSAEERAELSEMARWGLRDAFRLLYDQDRLYTWWDYRAGHFHKGLGLRIDMALISEDLAGALRACGIDRNFRKGQKPSDHAPLLVELEI